MRNMFFAIGIKFSNNCEQGWRDPFTLKCQGYVCKVGFFPVVGQWFVPAGIPIGTHAVLGKSQNPTNPDYEGQPHLNSIEKPPESSY